MAAYWEIAVHSAYDMSKYKYLIVDLLVPYYTNNDGTVYPMVQVR